MKKTIIVNIPMTIKLNKSVYVSEDPSVAASENTHYFPVLSYLDKNLKKSDELKFILITQKSEVSKYEQFLDLFKEEMMNINRYNVPVEYNIVSSEFKETKYVHEALMKAIIDNIDDDSEIIADITFGSKDVPIVEFTALNFAEQFLSCNVEHILYGQALFGDNNNIIKTYICDLVPLFSLSALTASLDQMPSDKARKMLNTLILMP